MNILCIGEYLTLSHRRQISSTKELQLLRSGHWWSVARQSIL